MLFHRRSRRRILKYHKIVRTSQFTYFCHVLMFVLLSLGLVLVIANSIRINDGFRRQKWPTTKGEVIGTDVVDGRLHRPQVTYHYEVKSKSYTNVSDLRVPYFGARSTRKEVAYKSIADFPKNREIRVFYNPSNPGESFLKPGATWDDYTRLSLGCTFLIAGICIAIFGAKKRNNTIIDPMPE